MCPLQFLPTLALCHVRIHMYNIQYIHATVHTLIWYIYSYVWLHSVHAEPMWMCFQCSTWTENIYGIMCDSCSFLVTIQVPLWQACPILQGAIKKANAALSINLKIDFPSDNIHHMSANSCFLFPISSVANERPLTDSSQISIKKHLCYGSIPKSCNHFVQ